MLNQVDNNDQVYGSISYLFEFNEFSDVKIRALKLNEGFFFMDLIEFIGVDMILMYVTCGVCDVW